MLYVLKSCHRAVMGSLLLLISLQTVCRNFPLERTIDFMMALKDIFLRAKGMRVRAAGKWMITFLQMYRKAICQDIRDFLPSVLDDFWLLHDALCLLPLVLKRHSLSAEPGLGQGGWCEI